MTTSASSASTEAPPADRYSAVRALYGSATLDAIQRSRVLVVGAGGIGCELLKTLVLTGFLHLDVIDLDTIDVSNLNRQFLFRRAHVGQSKAIIAREAAVAFNPSATITSHHANVKDSTFSPSFLSSFSLVLNALDNIDARRHVNRLCLASSIPLIESGTQSTSGQVFPILPHVSECYECHPVATPKTFAVCTIRSTPDRPVHCVVWAKHVFDALFGPEDEDNVMNDLRQTLRWEEAEAEREGDVQGRAEAFGRRLVSALFDSAIEKQLENAETWKNRKAPTPLRLSSLLPTTSDPLPPLPPPRSLDQQVLSPADTVRFLFHSLTALFTSHSSSLGSLSFDKDSDPTMDVVTALANLRMHNFHIGPQSRFKVKGIAGNIVHAIATTNAIAAGLIVIEAVKLLAAAPPSSPTALSSSTSRQVYISPYKPHLLQPQPLDPPRPTCYICSHSTLTLHCDPSTFSLRQLFDRVLVGSLAFVCPSVDVFNRDNAIGVKEDCEDDYLDRPLEGVRCGEGAMLKVEDEAQQQEVVLMVRRKTWDKPEERPSGYELTGKMDSQTQRPVEGEAEREENGVGERTSSGKAAGEGEADDDVCIVESSGVGGQRGETQGEKGTKKRLHSPDFSERKKMRIEEEVID